ncbi:MAG: anthranilate synthase component I family protein [Myxococcota bacterium]
MKPALHPIELLLRLPRESEPVLLLSGEGIPDLSRWSWCFAGPYRHTTELTEALRWARANDENPRAVGLIRYEQGVRWVAPDIRARPDPFGQPPSIYRVYDGGYRYDHVTGDGSVFGTAPELQAALALSETPSLSGGLEADLRPRWSKAHYERRLSGLLALIRDGEIYQGNLSFPLQGRYAGDPRAAFARLAPRAPSFAAYVGSRTGPSIVSASPECLVRFAGPTRHATSYPIKGTRPRSAVEAEDRVLREALATSEKDGAEHVMIVDLVRNDLGRVAEASTVRVDPFRSIESYPGVHHMVSAVHGTIRSEVQPEALLRSLFPGGSITGAPKRRAVEILDDVEGDARGMYTGSILLLWGDGSMSASIAIRTAEIMEDELRFGVGGGIVLDSDADDEWAETQAKARALSEALRA